MGDAAALIFLIGRILFPFLLLDAGVRFHVRKSSMAEGYARSIGFPVPAIAGWPTGLWMATGSLSVMLGAWGDIGALMIAMFVVPAAGWFHRFWKIEDEQQRQSQQVYFWRNVALLGGALVLFSVFATVGQDLSFTLTDPLFDLR
jgi:putative oxidoreductase